MGIKERGQASGFGRPAWPAALLTATLMLALASCTGEQTDSSADVASRSIRVVTTVGMLTDVVAAVGGERVEVDGLMGPGVDPHLYKASAGDVTTMQKADLIVYNGLHLEGAMAELFERMGSATPTVAAAEAIDPARLAASADNPARHDPHVWFDVSLWMEATRAVTEALVELDPTHAQDYRDRAGAYLARLEALDAYVKQRASELPPEQRVLITAHDAFHYFGAAYGFDVYGLQGISTVAEAGTSDLQRLADFIAERRIPAIFVESSVPRRAIEALQAAVEAKGFGVEIGGELFSDAMGSPGTPEGSYEGMVRHNIDTIVDALGGHRTRPREEP